MILEYISCLLSFLFETQNVDSSDEESLHIDTEVKPEVKGRGNSKVKKKGGNAAGILDLLQASKQVGGIDYNTNRYRRDTQEVRASATFNHRAAAAQTHTRHPGVAALTLALRSAVEWRWRFSH